MSELHQRALELAKNYRKIEGELLLVLEEIRRTKDFVSQGYSTLFDYMVKALNLGESTAYAFMTVLQKCDEVPMFREQVVSGELTLCNARRIAPVVTQDSAGLWVEFAKNSAVREIDREIAGLKPERVVEKITPKSSTRSELRIGVSLEFERKLKLLQDFLSHERRETVNCEQALEAGLDELLEKFSARRKNRVKKPVSIENEMSASDQLIPAYQIPLENDEVADSNQMQLANITSPASQKSPASQTYPANQVRPENKTITPKTKEIILARDNHQCSFLNSDGARCATRRFLEVHHIQHRKHGGGNELENLATLCSVHHSWLHLQEA